MKYRNARFNEGGSIDIELEHPTLGVVPFTASPDDPEEHGREIYAQLVADGNVAPYEAEIVPVVVS
jgi:hypothetical protein